MLSGMQTFLEKVDNNWLSTVISVQALSDRNRCRLLSKRLDDYGCSHSNQSFFPTEPFEWLQE